MFSVFPIVFVNSEKAIEADCLKYSFTGKCHIGELCEYWVMFSALRQFRGASPDTVGIEGITFGYCPLQRAVGKKVKLQRSPGKLIFPNYVSWQETQILEVPDEIIQYLNSD